MLDFFLSPDVILEIISLGITLLGIFISYRAGKRSAEHDAAVRRIEILRSEKRTAYEALIVAMNKHLQQPEDVHDFASVAYAAHSICGDKLNDLINEFKDLYPSSFDDPNHAKACELMPKIVLEIRHELKSLDDQLLALSNKKRKPKRTNEKG